MPADPRLKAQIQLVLDTHEDAAVFPDDWEERGDVSYVYRKDAILSREEHVGRVTESLDRNFARQRQAGQPSPYELRRLSAGLHHIALRGLPPVPEVLDTLDAEAGPGAATPDHLLYACPYPCPATEPIEVPPGTVEPFPPFSSPVPCGQPGHRGYRAACDGAGVTVGLVDTGLLADAAAGHPWLAGVTGMAEEPYFPGTDRQIRPYAGHGTFAAGCLRAMAPKARVHVEKGYDSAAEAFESDLVPVLENALDRHPDILVFSFVTATRKDLPLRAFDEFYERRLRPVKGLVVIAPAGNDGTSRWMWPAAYPWVVSVGALSASWRDRARFSNHGGWVDVYTPGEDLVNAYASGTFVCNEPPAGEVRHFDGMAKWSGTSFSTPTFAGLVAARMSGHGENGQLAADALLRLARSQAVPGIGAVLYPGQACVQQEAGSLAAASPG